jgi:putative hydrolase, NUDIX family
MYDAGVIPRDTPITLQNDELVTYEWVVGENLGDYVRPAMVRRLQEALKALETGEVLEISSDD